MSYPVFAVKVVLILTAIAIAFIFFVDNFIVNWKTLDYGIGILQNTGNNTLTVLNIEELYSSEVKYSSSHFLTLWSHFQVITKTVYS